MRLGDRICTGCGKEYWPKQQWIHAKCVPVVVHSEPLVVHEAEPVVVHKSRHGKYANLEKRKEYRRNWMRADRDLKKPA